MTYDRKNIYISKYVKQDEKFVNKIAGESEEFKECYYLHCTFQVIE